MEENLLQSLQIIAYLCIALVSIVIAVYAIGVSYQGRETYRSRMRKEKRRGELERKVRELGKKADVEGIKGEIKRHDLKIAEINSELSYLSIWRTVIFPIISFMIALIIIAVVIYVDPTGNVPLPRIFNTEGTPVLVRDALTLASIFAVAVGVFFLIKTLFAIEWAASRIPVPEFDVRFENGTKEMTSKSKESKDVEFCIENVGEDIAENLQIFLMFPPSFTVNKGANYIVVKQSRETDHPNYTAAVFAVDIVHYDTILDAYVGLTMPEQKDIYEIPVSIKERKTGAHKDKLTIKIVE